MDDALSSVDASTETRILEHLRRRQGQHSMILVSHRISSIQDLNQILVLDEGSLVERGTHESLVEQNGLYAQMHRRQLLEARLEALQ